MRGPFDYDDDDDEVEDHDIDGYYADNKRQFRNYEEAADDFEDDRENWDDY